MDPKRTREVLAWYAESYEIVGAGARPGERLASIIDAAEWAVDLFEECENCLGIGTYKVRSLSNGETREEPCPSCQGRGFSLNQERFDAAWPKAMAKIGAFLHPRLVAAGNPIDITSGEMGELAKAAAEAAILAFLVGGTEW